MKKFLSSVLVIITIFSVFPFSAFAEETNTQIVIEEGTQQSTEFSQGVTGSSQEGTETEQSESVEPSTGDSSQEPTEDPAQDPTVESTEPTTQPVILKPASVANFAVAEKSTKAVKLSWAQYKGSANRFYIYRAKEISNGVIGEYQLIATIKNTTKTYYKDSSVLSGTFYKYKLVPSYYEKSKDKKGDASKVSVFVPLEKSSSLVVKKATTNKIKIKWAAIPRSTKYEIYRVNSDTGVSTKIKTTTDLNYIDKNITSGQGYIYKVRGVKVANKTLRYSEFATVTTAANVTKVKGVKVKSLMRRGLFTWDEVSGADGYVINKQNNKGKYTYYGTTKNNSFLTNKLKENTTYKFKIKAYKTVNGKKVYGKTKKVKVNIVDGAYGKKASGTYIEVCTETQQMYMYVNDKLYVSTPIVTGYYNLYDTTHGFHYVINKKTNARLRGAAGDDQWDVEVNYWVAFTYDGQGLHDSTWRYSGYGGNIYKNNGSHGCVNTPLDAMKKIYKKVYVGMPIIVY